MNIEMSSKNVENYRMEYNINSIQNNKFLINKWCLEEKNPDIMILNEIWKYKKNIVIHENINALIIMIILE